MSIDEMRACLDKLETMKSEIKEICRLIDGKQKLFGIEKKRAQQLLKVLKKTLLDEYRRLSTHRGQANLNQTDKKYYLWAVAKAHESIRIKYNSVPDFRWRLDLGAAISEIDHYIDLLRGQMNN